MLARDQATLARAQADAAAGPRPAASMVAAQQQVDQTEADAKIAAANLQADQAALETDRIRLDYSMVEAPIDGRVGAVRVTPGNIVRSSDGGEGLVTITQMKPLRVTFTLPERDLAALRAADCRWRLSPSGSSSTARRKPAQRAASTSSTAVSTRLGHDHRQGHGRQRGRCAVAGPVCRRRGGARQGARCGHRAAGGDPARPGRPVRLYGRRRRQGCIRKVVSGDSIGDEVDRGRGPAGRRPCRDRGPAAAAQRHAG